MEVFTELSVLISVTDHVAAASILHSLCLPSGSIGELVMFCHWQCSTNGHSWRSWVITSPSCIDLESFMLSLVMTWREQEMPLEADVFYALSSFQLM